MKVVTKDRAYAILAAAMLVACGLFLKSLIDPFDDKPFEKGAWARDDDRGAMAESAAGVARGLTKPEVLELLGEPEPGSDEVWEYHLGSYSDHFMDDAFLYIHFDHEGRASYTKIDGY